MSYLYSFVGQLISVYSVGPDLHHKLYGSVERPPTNLSHWLSLLIPNNNLCKTPTFCSYVQTVKKKKKKDEHLRNQSCLNACLCCLASAGIHE